MIIEMYLNTYLSKINLDLDLDFVLSRVFKLGTEESI